MTESDRSRGDSPSRETLRAAKRLWPMLFFLPLAASLVYLVLRAVFAPVLTNAVRDLVLMTLASQLCIALAALLTGPVPSPAERPAVQTSPRLYAEAVLLGIFCQAGFIGLNSLLPPLPGGIDLPADGEAGDQLLLALLIVAAPALFEEWLFRGRLYPLLLTCFPETAAGLLSALLFAVHHDSPQGFLAQLTVGVAAASLARRSGSLRPGIVLHMVFNLSALLCAMLQDGLISQPGWLTLALMPAAVILWQGRPTGRQSPSCTPRRSWMVWLILILALHVTLMALLLAGVI